MYQKLGRGIATFGNIEPVKHNFQHQKNLIFLEDVDIDIMQVSRTVSSCEIIIGILLVPMIMVIINLNHYACF